MAGAGRREPVSARPAGTRRMGCPASARCFRPRPFRPSSRDSGPNLSGRRGLKGLALSLATMDERSEEHTSELQSLTNLVCRLLLEKKKNRHLIYRPHEH